ncbi:beta-galactosidase [Crossiella equi]|uniref:Beta-galactosidase n=1 Tax=Crossiella equi TaxID=130796 RepID=A0ABS5AN86_9PSEU|nr:glycoside hydrolase family 2 TIM barrel-domain containing protein [Crossiella equi]MBP2478039.1 beta-galactosidase [Crossiella equi]
MSRSRLAALVCTLTTAVTSFLAVTPAASAYEPPRTRQSTGLDAGWRFERSDVPGAQAPGFDDSRWSTVSVPHTWNAQDGQDGGGDYHRGTGWYRRHLAPPATLAGKRVWLQFDGVNTVAEVWLNGIRLGEHRGGYAAFRFDATNAIRLAQDNVLAVRVNNSANPDIAPISADYTFFGGIYRGVSLVAVDPLAIRLGDFGGPGVYLRQRAVTQASATVEVTTKAWNNHTGTRQARVRTVITDAGGAIVAEATTANRAVDAATEFTTTQTLTVRQPRRWQGKADPYLYRAHVEITDAATGRVTDSLTQPLGLRAATVAPDTGFSLNGQRLRLRGVNAHQDRLGQGWAVSPAQQRQDFDLMDEMGVNAYRTAHYQQSQHVMDLADRRGYVVWTEIPLVNQVTDSAAFRANAQQQLSELIRQNFNHPSVFFWGIGNEQASDNAVTNALLDTLAKQVDAEDSGRLSTYATHKGDTDGLASHTSVIGYNKYYGWYGLSDTGPGRWADQLHAKDPARRISISEYGAGASVHQHEENPKPPPTTGKWHPEEYQNLLHENHWKQIEARPYLWGSFVWNMFDFAVDSRGEGDTNGRNDKGLVTYDRQTRKDAFYYYKANWNPEPTVYLASRRWTRRTEAATTVKAYANLDSVTLTLNGVAQGTRTSPDRIHTWPVTLRPGANTVTVSGTKNGRPHTDTVTWTLVG